MSSMSWPLIWPALRPGDFRRLHGEAQSGQILYLDLSRAGQRDAL